MKKNEDFKKRIYAYVISLVRFLKGLPKDIILREIVSQLMRSGTSIGANFFEAQSASSKKDYINYFTHSLKSANESKFWFSVLIDSNLVPSKLVPDCKRLFEETNELSKILAASILTMKGRR